MMGNFTLIMIMMGMGSLHAQVLRSNNSRAPKIEQKMSTPIGSLAVGDTIFSIPLPGYFVNAANAATFTITTEDVDQLTPNSSSIPDTSFGVYSSVDSVDIDPGQGDVDTGYVYLATSWFTPPATASNWLIMGPVSIPSGGAKLTWRARGLDPSFLDGYEVMVSSTGGASGNFTNTALYSVPDNDPSLSASWSNQTLIFDSVSFGGQNLWIAFHHNANDQYILALDNMVLTETGVTVVGSNDECAGATDINTSFGGALGAEIVIGPFSNDSATTGPQDPTIGFECFGEPTGNAAAPELNNTLWFSFTGDGEIYFIETGNCAGVTNYIDDGDTQLALYQGTCGALVPVACNEDGPNATASEYPAGFTITTVPGTVYYMIVDGFNFNGALSNGEFCLKITHKPAITCSDSTVNVGTQTQNTTNVCFNDTLVVSTTGAVTPNIGDYFGIGWVISSADISGNNNPLNDPSIITSYTFTSPAPLTSTRSFINDGLFPAIQPGNTYYWTPVVFGNATAVGVPVFLQDLTLDTSCVLTGTSLMFNFLLQGDPLCSGVGIAENLAGKGVSILGYPSPVKDVLTLEFMNTENLKSVISITDYTGRTLQTNTMVANAGKNTLNVSVKNLASGTYLLTLKNDNGSRTIKFVKE